MKELDSAEATKLDADTLPWSPAVWGPIYGAISAVAYTAANVCLRALTDLDPVWVSCVKAFPTVVATAPWLFVRLRPGDRPFPPFRVVAMLVAAAVLGQLGGNVAFQWSLGVIGLAVTVPLCMGTLIFGSAVLGRVYLNEPLTALTVAALTVLVVAIWVLSLGARGSAIVGELLAESTWLVTLAVGAACLAGISYAVLGVVIRGAVIGRASVAAATFCVSATGVLTLGSASVARLGLPQLLQTPPPDFAIMVLAGLFNLVAFVSLTRALQIATLGYVNALNASQVAMAAAAGVLIFGEQPSAALLFGCTLTIVGLLMIPRPGKRAVNTEL